MIAEFLQAAQAEVDNHSIYVWGGSGQLCADVSEEWIRKKEQGHMPEASVKEWAEVMSGPFRDVARCFDCSGFVSWCLNKAGAFKGRTDCDGLFARCYEIYTPTNGCLLFRTNPKKPTDETHVGIYYGGKQYEARGRAVGVVCMDYNPNYWQRLAWFKALKPDETPTPPEPTTGKTVKVVGGSVRVRAGDNVKTKHLFTAHRGDKFPLVAVAPSGWYQIETDFNEAYITNKKRYTVLIDG
jgi:hypothetical protein